jgi:hypothetical protein
VDVDVVREAEEEGEEAGHDHAQRQEVAQVHALGNDAAAIGGRCYKRSEFFPTGLPHTIFHVCRLHNYGSLTQGEKNTYIPGTDVMIF